MRHVAMTLKRAIKQACAANRRYSMRRGKCKQNKRYHTSARMTLAYNKSTSGHGTDGQTDRQTDRQSATQYAAPSYGGGRRIIRHRR